MDGVRDPHIVHLPWQQLRQIAGVSADQVQHSGFGVLKFGADLLNHGGVYVHPVQLALDDPHEGCREITVTAVQVHDHHPWLHLKRAHDALGVRPQLISEGRPRSVLGQ